MSHSTSRGVSDGSVTFSLAELAKIEEQRVREDDERRARAVEERERKRIEAEARLRAEERARIEAETAGRAQRERAAAEEAARLEARKQAAVDVARIEAEAKARLDAEKAAREHELVLLRERKDRTRSRLQWVLGAVIGLTVCGGSASAWAVGRHVDALEQEAERLRERQVALAREREQAATSELAALDRRHAALRALPVASGAPDALAAADSARSSIDSAAPDQARLRVFRDALDMLAGRIDSLRRLAHLDQRRGDLAKLASAQRRTIDALSAVDVAAKTAAKSADPSALDSYSSALDVLRDELARPAGGGGGRRVEKDPGVVCTNPHDPLCGLNGRPLIQ
jgi:hypothetical protein